MSADALLAEAEAAPVEGWGFGWMKGRSTTSPLPWNFTTIAAAELEGARAALDMGTGGGEWLSSLPRPAELMVATESWEPNVAVAGRRLGPQGVAVLHDEGAIDNFDQAGGDARGRLPFRDAVFDVVLNRHESFVAAEVVRVLRPGAQFLTQQAGTASAAFHDLLGLPVPDVEEFHLPLALQQVEAAGLTVLGSERAEEDVTFGDIGVLARYLRQVPWAVPGFTVAACREQLARLHGQPIHVAQERFWLRAVKPA